MAVKNNISTTYFFFLTACHPLAIEFVAVFVKCYSASDLEVSKIKWIPNEEGAHTRVKGAVYLWK